MIVSVVVDVNVNVCERDGWMCFEWGLLECVCVCVHGVYFCDACVRAFVFAVHVCVLCLSPCVRV